MTEEDSSSTNAVAVEQHPLFWYSDGSIILRAGSTIRGNCTVLFKVHKSHIAKHSSIFADMFVVAEVPPDEKYEGTPVIDVHDSAEDWEYLLRFLYGELGALSVAIHDPNLEMSLMGPMRLMKKYDMKGIHGDLSSRICSHWPSTLREWTTYNLYLKHLNSSTAVLEPCSAICLANEHSNLQRILPVAFYCLSQISVEHSWFDMRPGLHHDTPAARWHLLSAHDYFRLTRGRERLGAAVRESIDGLRSSCYSACKYRGGSDKMVLAALEHFSGSRIPADPFHLFNFYADDKQWESFGLRSECREACRKYLKEAQEKTWRMLPDIFGTEGLLKELPDWDSD